MSSRSRVTVTANTLSSFGMGKVFKSPPSTTITGLDIDASGRYLITTSSSNYLKLYDCLDGKLKKSVLCSKYGTSYVTFTHHNKAILIGSSVDYTIKYYSLYDNSYIRTFTGHSDRITSIKMCYLDDTFLTSSIDRHIRLWDLRQASCIAICKVNGRPTIAQDNEGLIFAIGTGTGKNSELKLYDRRKYSVGPFETFNKMNGIPIINYEWCDILFSPNNKYILISTRTNLLFLIDAYKGNLIQKYNEYNNNSNYDMCATFTPNGKHIAVGDENGNIHFWNTHSGSNTQNSQKYITKWNGHPKPIKHFKFNPKYLTAVSASQHVALWLPKINQNNSNNNNNNNIKKKSCLKKKINQNIKNNNNNSLLND